MIVYSYNFYYTMYYEADALEYDLKYYIIELNNVIMIKFCGLESISDF